MPAQGWSYWTYKSFDDITTQNSATETFFDEKGDLQQAKVKALARTYAPTIAGKPDHMHFSPESGEFDLTYTVHRTVSSLTSQVFLQTDLYYPNGFSVRTLPARQVKWQVNSQGEGWILLDVVHDSDLTEGTQISVAIAPSSV
uniref:Glycoside hydrolase family 5 C-terminal domain-containing protein n=1 Tax=Rhizochromulina marina TaxID=1034831 RepID=A0A7S2WLA4_9STRA